MPQKLGGLAWVFGTQASIITPVAARYWARDGFPRLGTVLGTVEHRVPLLASQAMTTSCRMPEVKPICGTICTLRKLCRVRFIVPEVSFHCCSLGFCRGFGFKASGVIVYSTLR